MSERNTAKNPTLKFIETSIKWSWLWVGTALLFGVLGLAYVLLLKKDYWVASQGLMVRDEASGAVMRLGRFQSQVDMKAAQETIIELAHNPQVIHRALEKIGAEPSMLMNLRKSPWPSTSDVEAATKIVNVRAPRGAELGTTEVIYLDTKHGSRKRAYDLNVAICDALTERLQQIRQFRADAVLIELTTAHDVAKSVLGEVTEKLQAIERDAGEDLSDLRGMTDSNSSTSSSRIQLDNIKSELRQAESQLQQMTLDLDLAEKAYASPRELLSPNGLVNSQPGLRKLSEGLADARLNASQLQGRFTEQHPLVLASLKAENVIQARLRDELGLARQSLVNDVSLIKRRIVQLQEQRDEFVSRMESLADIRAEYANLTANVSSRSRVLQDAERQLSEVRAARDAAIACSLVTRIDDPFSSETPVGPGRTTILACSTLAGLFFGFGALFLVAPIEGSDVGRRSSDLASTIGRRSSDLASTISRRSSDFASAVGRRFTDHFPANRVTDRAIDSAIAEPTLAAFASAAPTAANRSQSPSVSVRVTAMRRYSDTSQIESTEAEKTEVRPVEASLEESRNKPRRPLPPSVPRQR